MKHHSSFGFKISTILVMLLLPFSAGAVPNNVPKQVLDACLKASDFQGCVNVMTGKSTAPVETKITVDMDKIRSTGNSCPSGYAYIGGGYCREVRCYINARGHDPLLGGKGWSCSGGYTMQFTGEPIRATTDERFPLVEPELGKQYSIQNGLTEAELKAGKFQKRYPKDSVQSGWGFRADWSRQANRIQVIQAPTQCAAYRKGIRVDDLILKYDGREFPSDEKGAADIWNTTRDQNPRAVNVILLRGDSRISVDLDFASLGECTFDEIIKEY